MSVVSVRSLPIGAVSKEPAINHPGHTAIPGGLGRGVAAGALGGGYELDGYGGLHRFGGAPRFVASAYWPGWDIARGVVLVEGEGDRDLLHTWWTSSATGSGQDAPDSLAIAIASVGGDKNFGFVIRALEDWRVPWAIVADGPVLSPDHEMSLQLQLSRVRARDDQRHPDPGASFGDWQIYWAVQGVYTLADTFGIGRSANHEGEIEAHLSSYCPDQWTAAGSLFPNSKTRRIAWFAQNTLCSPRAADLYTAVLRTLTRQAPPE